jgi:nucleotide-binding universal stress UspA family protein
LTAAEIVRFAGDGGYDLIVMGTHGRRGVARVLLGSVAARVVQTAGCPVLTVRRPAQKNAVTAREQAAASPAS